MKKPASFYSSLFWMIVLNVVIKPAWVFGIDRQVQNQVGTEEYGIYFSLFNLSVVFVFLLDWGLTIYFNRQLAIHGTASSLASFLQLKLLFSLAYAVIVFWAAWITGVRRWNIVLYVILIQVLYSLLMFFRAALTARQFFSIDAWISVIDKSLMLIVAGILLYYPLFHGAMNIARFAWLQVVCLATANLVALFFLWKKDLLHYLRFSGFPGMKLFKQAIPFALVVLLMSLHARIDAFLLERINDDGAYEAGIYAGAYRLLDAANMVGTLATAFLLPYIAKRWSDKDDINEVVLTGRNFLLMFSIAVSVVVFFMGDWIQELLYHLRDPKAADVLKWCLPALIGYSLTQVYGTVLTATGHIRAFCTIVAIFALINITLNVILIPWIGAIGCCITALCTQIGGGLTIAWFASRKIGLVVNARAVFVYIFTALLLGSFLYGGTIWSLNKYFLIAFSIFVTVLIMHLSRMMDLTKWMKAEQTK